MTTQAEPRHSWQYQFTVLTPSYNRAHTLERAYQSLCKQSFQDFEWIIIDDGSVDSTKERVNGWQQEASFPIVYQWQENQHKKTAFNHGVRLAQGELVVALDSDDTLEPNALEQMAAAWRDIPLPQRHNYVAVIGLCQRPDGHVVGDMYPYDQFDASSLDLNFKHSIKGEKFGCLSTAVLRKFPFPEHIDGYVPESIVWRAIARAGYLTRFVNQVYRVYYDSSDSLSEQGRSTRQHALGLWLLAQDTVVNCLPWFRYRPKAFLMAAARYTRFWLHMRDMGVSPPQGYELRGLAAWLLVIAMWPAGVVLYLRDRARS
ncbi:glycosyltransferase [Paenalcaligenes niemegkensis]|uniref:glycosyltransferase family 2 protein n=1 Tax=Paenalcaligenes niemegkensis TaxID=2895469 RepID=UPI001EE890D9|nr:glycosyltransferase family 2 protein [Paenalcaligenes niemegkensis]MCQ9617126.1 glycosyltransferase [Paenalcaligenes niemegkensis]